MTIPTGTYTFENEEGECKSFRVSNFVKGSLRGKTCIGLCHGDAKPTYFAFTSDNSVKLWRRFHSSSKVKWWGSFFRRIIKSELFKEGEELIKEQLTFNGRKYNVTFRKYTRSIG